MVIISKVSIYVVIVYARMFYCVVLVYINILNLRSSSIIMKLGIFYCVNLKCYIIVFFYNKSELIYILYEYLYLWIILGYISII